MRGGEPSLAVFLKTLLFWTLASGVVNVAFIYLLLAMVGMAPTPFDCITEPRGRFSGVSGFDFEISETNCDAIAKTDTISVFVSKPGHTRRTLLLEYDPADEVPMPVITSVDPHTVQVSVPKISSLLFRRDGLKGLSVNYKIDVILYRDSGMGNLQR